MLGVGLVDSVLVGVRVVGMVGVVVAVRLVGMEWWWRWGWWGGGGGGGGAGDSRVIA